MATEMKRKRSRIEVDIQRITAIPYCSALHQVIAAIERKSFQHPFTVSQIQDHISDANVICKVAMEQTWERSRLVENPVGYIIWVEGASVWHLDRLAVKPGYRRQGVGSQLMAEFLGARRRPRMSEALVPERNVEGQLFLRAHGWRCRADLSLFETDKGDTGLLHFERREA
jgi:ribosomal protein S18 acetylase RimI-like enzyme